MDIKHSMAAFEDYKNCANKLFNYFSVTLIPDLRIKMHAYILNACVICKTLKCSLLQNVLGLTDKIIVWVCTCPNFEM